MCVCVCVCVSSPSLLDYTIGSISGEFNFLRVGLLVNLFINLEISKVHWCLESTISIFCLGKEKVKMQESKVDINVFSTLTRNK